MMKMNAGFLIFSGINGSLIEIQIFPPTLLAPYSDTELDSTFQSDDVKE